MNWTVYKHSFRAEPGITQLTVPEGSKILSVQNQFERLTVWYQRVAPDTTSLTRFIDIELLVTETGCVLSGVGKLAPNNLDFLGTVQFAEGSYVLHVFQVRH